MCFQMEGGGTSAYGVTVKAWSSRTSICVEVHVTLVQCGPAGQWLEVNTRENGRPTSIYPSIRNRSESQSTVVKGIIVSEYPEYEPPPPPPPPPASSWHYQEIGGEFLGKPGVTRSSETGVHIFVQGLDNNLWQTWTNGSGWYPWQDVSWFGGGSISSGPGAVTESNGTVAAAAKLPDNEVGVWDYPPAGPWGFQTIGGGTILGEPSISLGHVFVRGLDGNLWQKWWTGSAWTPWQNLSAVLGGPIASSPAAVSAATNQLTVVARLANNHVGVWSWTGSQWIWQQLEGEIQGDPAIASGQTGGVNVFAQGLDGNLWQTWTSGVGWSPWEQLSTTPIKSSPAASGWAGSNPGVDVVARSSTNQVGLWWYGH